MVPFQEKELPSSPSELAYYARSCADEFSFLINEEYCNTSRLCENCYSMRRELERLANKVQFFIKIDILKINFTIFS